MSSSKAIAFVVILSVVVTMMIGSFFSPASVGEKKQETAFERIMRTGVIRCGYYVFPPIMNRDPNTGEMSGVTYDFMNRLAERAGLKIEWAAEVTWANWIPEIQSGRFDVACTPMWPELSMGRAVDFTDSLFYSGLSLVIRKADPKFGSVPTLDRLNRKDVIILTQDGNATATIAKNSFPSASYFSLPETASGGEFFQALLNKKVDAMLTDRNGLYLYEKENGKNFLMVDPQNPIKLQSFPMAIQKSEVDLLNFLNMSIREMDYSGDIDRILRKWEPEPGLTYLRRAKSFQ